MDKFDLMISAEEISARVKEIADQISRDYEGESLVVIGVLTGAFIFTADLVRELTVDVENIDFIHLSSYAGTESTGNFVFKKDISIDISGKNVLIVEDIVDTGVTLNYLKSMLAHRGAASIRIAALLDKTARRTIKDLKVDYVCFDIPDAFVVGYGLDYDQTYRNLPDIGVLSPKIYEGK